MFVALLLAAGLLALEREQHAFGRLVRGLVSRTGLLSEKVLLAALCALGGLPADAVSAWPRSPDWTGRARPRGWLALAAGGLGFAAMGTAIGALAREVQAASLLAFALSLPVAFLALVPSGAVDETLFDGDRRRLVAVPVQARAGGARRGDLGRRPRRPAGAPARAHARLLGLARLSLRRFG